MTVLIAQTWIQVFHCEESWNYKSSLQALCLQCLHRAYTATGIVLARCVPPPTAHIGKIMEFFYSPLELGTMGAPRSAYMPCIKLGNFWFHVSKYEKLECSLEVFFLFLSILFLSIGARQIVRQNFLESSLEQHLKCVILGAFRDFCIRKCVPSLLWKSGAWKITYLYVWFR